MTEGGKHKPQIILLIRSVNISVPIASIDCTQNGKCILRVRPEKKSSNRGLGHGYRFQIGQREHRHSEGNCCLWNYNTTHMIGRYSLAVYIYILREKGELICIEGPVGGGKSSMLMAIMAGMKLNDGGMVWLQDIDDGN